MNNDFYEQNGIDVSQLICKQYDELYDVLALDDDKQYSISIGDQPFVTLIKDGKVLFTYVYIPVVFIDSTLIYMWRDKTLLQKVDENDFEIVNTAKDISYLYNDYFIEKLKQQSEYLQQICRISKFHKQLCDKKICDFNRGKACLNAQAKLTCNDYGMYDFVYNDKKYTVDIDKLSLLGHMITKQAVNIHNMPVFHEWLNICFEK